MNSDRIVINTATSDIIIIAEHRGSRREKIFENAKEAIAWAKVKRERIGRQIEHINSEEAAGILQDADDCIHKIEKYLPIYTIDIGEDIIVYISSLQKQII